MSNQLIIEGDYKQNFSNLIDNEKFKNVLIITSNGNQKRGFQDSFIKILNEYKCQHLLHLVNKYPDFEEIDKIFENFSNSNIDLVLSIGGGSVLDIGKIFATCNIPEEKLNNVTSITERDSKDSIYSIAVPTTSGSGAESTKFATIWSEKTKQKFSYENEYLIPDLVYLVPEFSKSLTHDLTLTTTLDALCHAVDSLLNKNSTEQSRDYSKKAISIISKNLTLLLEDLENIELRKETLYASNLSGKAINISRTSLNHSISYPLTNYYGVPHGLACAFSVVTTFEYYKNQISNLDFGRYVNLAVEVIEQLNLSQIYKTKLKQLDVGIITDEALKNSRSENFLFHIDKKVINHILSEAKKYYLTA